MIRIAAKIYSFFSGPTLTFLKIPCKSVLVFLRKVANKQTNNDDYITSLAEVIKVVGINSQRMMETLPGCFMTVQYTCLGNPLNT